MSRRIFSIQKIIINGRSIEKVIIDDHVDKHDDLTDDIILDLVRLLDGVEQTADDIKVPYEYYVNLLILNKRQYRLVWLLEDNELYVGIITAYRDTRSK